MTARSDDSLSSELRELGAEAATADVLIECPTLLALLPERLSRPDATTSRQAQVLRSVLKAVIAGAYDALGKNPHDVLASRVVAAGALFGFVTESPGGPARSLDEMPQKPTASREVRQALAGQWLVNRQATARGVRRQLSHVYEAFHDALLDWLQDDDAVESLARQLDIPGPPPSQPHAQEAGSPGSDTATARPPDEREKAATPASEPSDGTDVDDSPRRSRWTSRRGIIIVGLAAVVVTAAIVAPVVVTANSEHHTRSSTAPPPGGGAPLSQIGASSPPVLTFDALGGGSTIIGVFPGVMDVARDKVANGTFRDGDTVGALCKTNGRTVTSDTSVGERARQSNVWIRIAGSPGVVQYAP